MTTFLRGFDCFLVTNSLHADGQPDDAAHRVETPWKTLSAFTHRVTTLRPTCPQRSPARVLQVKRYSTRRGKPLSLALFRSVMRFRALFVKTCGSGCSGSGLRRITAFGGVVSSCGPGQPCRWFSELQFRVTDQQSFALIQ